MIATLQNRHKINPLDRTGVACVIEQAARLADDGEKLSLRMETLVDLMREADYWSKKSNSALIRAEDVETALEKQRYRQDRIREKMQEQVTRGIRLIDTEGTKIAQALEVVMGLTAAQLVELTLVRSEEVSVSPLLQALEARLKKTSDLVLTQLTGHDFESVIKRSVTKPDYVIASRHQPSEVLRVFLEKSVCPVILVT